MAILSPVFFVSLLLALLGLLNLHSATQGYQNPEISSHVVAQFLYHVAGIVVALVLSRVRSRQWHQMAYLVYAVNLLLLLAVLFFGESINGSRSWLSLGPVNVQPSEFAKIALILVLSAHLAKQHSGSLGFVDLLVPVTLTAVPMTLVLLQGDLGTSLFFGLILGTLFLAKGVKGVVIVPVLVLAVAGAAMAHHSFLKPYQKKRIVSFLDPELDPRGSGYHLVQSKIAVGSGGVLGNGYLKGKSHKLKYLPERHTDFVFPVWAEEWGLLGGTVLLALYGFLILAGLHLASRVVSPFGALCAMGLSSLFFWHVFTNLGGVLGLIPLTGVPLVFFSYGGSAVITAWCAVGILLSLRRKPFFP